VEENVEALWKKIGCGSDDIVVNCAADTRWGVESRVYIKLNLGERNYKVLFETFLGMWCF
jgi:hypothetical protein